MNGYQIADTIQEANDLLALIDRRLGELQHTIRRHAEAKSRLQEIQIAMDEAEAEMIIGWEIMAGEKSGPLAGIAKTSRAYGYAIENELAQARRQELSDIDIDLKRAQAAYEQAAIEFDQASAAFKAVRYAADLKASILKVMATL